MKKLTILLTVVLFGISLIGCKYDDDALWSEMEQVKDRVTVLEEAVKKSNEDIVALQTIVEALMKNVYVTAVTPTENGYTITFSDNKTATISNGKDGIDAPIVSVMADSIGDYYWTLGGEWLEVDGKKIKANGQDGKDAVTPQIRINETTKEWEISTDHAQTWISTGVVAEGTDGDSLFQSVDTSEEGCVTFTLADGSKFKLSYNDGSVPLFILKEIPEVVEVVYGESVAYVVDAQNVADYIIQTPEGWKASYENNTFTITAPQKELCHFEKEGTIAIFMTSAVGKSAIVKLQVKSGEWVDGIVLRTLTFEDNDAKFSPYSLDYAGVEISKWSDLIDEKEYGGALNYGDYFSAEYTWWDENNTELTHTFPYNFNCYCFWGGGHAISNYASTDVENNGYYENQLTVFGEKGKGGHNGSANFCMHFGYIDGSPWNGTEFLPEIAFADGKARVIDHMWVNNSTYAINCYTNGNGLTASIGPDDWVKLIATGYNENDEEVGTVEIYLCNGPEHIVMEWTKWDLSSLGKVVRVTFNVTGSSDNGYGYSQPAYFAYDDVAVQFTEKVFK